MTKKEVTTKTLDIYSTEVQVITVPRSANIEEDLEVKPSLDEVKKTKLIQKKGFLDVPKRTRGKKVLVGQAENDDTIIFIGENLDEKQLYNITKSENIVSAELVEDAIDVKIKTSTASEEVKEEAKEEVEEEDSTEDSKEESKEESKPKPQTRRSRKRKTETDKDA